MIPLFGGRTPTKETMEEMAAIEAAARTPSFYAGRLFRATDAHTIDTGISRGSATPFYTGVSRTIDETGSSRRADARDTYSYYPRYIFQLPEMQVDYGAVDRASNRELLRIALTRELEGHANEEGVSVIPRIIHTIHPFEVEQPELPLHELRLTAADRADITRRLADIALLETAAARAAQYAENQAANTSAPNNQPWSPKIEDVD